MSRKLPIRIVRSAADQIAKASAWWDANRPKAPGALREEIERALELVSTQPLIGAKAETSSLQVCDASISAAFVITSTIE